MKIATTKISIFFILLYLYFYQYASTMNPFFSLHLYFSYYRVVDKASVKQFLSVVCIKDTINSYGSMQNIIWPWNICMVIHNKYCYLYHTYMFYWKVNVLGFISMNRKHAELIKKCACNTNSWIPPLHEDIYISQRKIRNSSSEPTGFISCLNFGIFKKCYESLPHLISTMMNDIELCTADTQCRRNEIYVGTLDATLYLNKTQV